MTRTRADKDRESAMINLKKASEADGYRVLLLARHLSDEWHLYAKFRIINEAPGGGTFEISACVGVPHSSRLAAANVGSGGLTTCWLDSDSDSDYESGIALEVLTPRAGDLWMAHELTPVLVPLPVGARRIADPIPVMDFMSAIVKITDHDDPGRALVVFLDTGDDEGKPRTLIVGDTAYGCDGDVDGDGDLAPPRVPAWARACAVIGWSVIDPHSAGPDPILVGSPAAARPMGLIERSMVVSAVEYGAGGPYRIGLEILIDEEGAHRFVYRPMRREDLMGYGAFPQEVFRSAITRISYTGAPTMWRIERRDPDGVVSWEPCDAPLNPPHLNLPDEEHGRAWGGAVTISEHRIPCYRAVVGEISEARAMEAISRANLEAHAREAGVTGDRHTLP